MTAPLTDFEPAQLNYLLSVIEEKIDDVHLQRMKVELREDSEEVSWLLKDIDKDAETLNLLRVQLYNAQADIKLMDLIKQRLPR